MSDLTAWIDAGRTNTSNYYVYAQLKNNLLNVGSLKHKDIGDKSCASGVFDGNGYTISGLKITDGAMFRKTSDFVMKNVGFVNTTFVASFLYLNSEHVETTSLINCYFNIVHTSKVNVPFVQSAGIELVENVIFNTQIAYKTAETTVFQKDRPQVVKNLYVIGKNTFNNNKEIPAFDGTEDELRGKSFLSVSAFKSAGLTSFNSCWDFDAEGEIWVSAQKTT